MYRARNHSIRWKVGLLEGRSKERRSNYLPMATANVGTWWKQFFHWFPITTGELALLTYLQHFFQGDTSAAYRDGACGSLAIHEDDVSTAGNKFFFYNSVIVPLLSHFSISKIEKSEFKFLGMRLKQTPYFAVSLSQDTTSIKDLPQGVDSLTEEKKQSILKSLVDQLLYLDLTRPDLAFLISDLSRSYSKTSDERLRVARALLKKVRGPAKSIVYHETLWT